MNPEEARNAARKAAQVDPLVALRCD